MTFVVYLHRRNDTGDVFYVGKGRGRRAKARYGRNRWWKHVVEKAGGFTAEVIASYEEEGDAYEHERCAIACFRAAGTRLCNMTTGGEGGPGAVVTESTRRKMSEAAIRRGRSAKHEAALLEASRRPRSPETRAKISESLRGKPRDYLNPEAKARMRAAHLGKQQNDATRAKKTAAQLRRWGVPGAREKASEVQRARREAEKKKKNRMS